MNEEFKQSLSGPLWNMHFGFYEEDTDVVHVGRSKRDGAKVGSGRYHLGSGEHPYQHVKQTDSKTVIDKTGQDVKPSKKTIGVSNGAYTIYGDEGMLYKGKNVVDALLKIKDPVQENLLKDIQDSNARIEKIKVQKNGDDNSTILRVDLNRDGDTLSKGYKTASSASVIRDELTVNQLQNLGYKIRYVSTDDKFNIKCIQARKGKNEAEINFLTNKEVRNPNVVPVAIGTALGGIPVGTVTAIVSSKRKYKNYMEHSLSTDLYNMYFGSYEEDTDIAHVGRSKRDGAKVGSGRYPLGSGKNPNQHDKSTKHEKITSLKNGEHVTVNMFGKPKKLEVRSMSGDYDEQFNLNNEELDLLNWLISNVNIEDYSDEIISYIENEYDKYSDNTKVKDLKYELDIRKIIIDTSELKNKDYPEISYCGECECDPEHGICIGFRDKKLLGIDQYDWAL